MKNEKYLPSQEYSTLVEENVFGYKVVVGTKVYAMQPSTLNREIAANVGDIGGHHTGQFRLCVYDTTSDSTIDELLKVAVMIAKRNWCELAGHDERVSARCKCFSDGRQCDLYRNTGLCESEK